MKSELLTEIKNQIDEMVNCCENNNVCDLTTFKTVSNCIQKIKKLGDDIHHESYKKFVINKENKYNPILIEPEIKMIEIELLTTIADVSRKVLMRHEISGDNERKSQVLQNIVLKNVLEYSTKYLNSSIGQATSLAIRFK